MTVQARLTDTNGKGVGRWRMYYRAEDITEARWCARSLVPSCQVRVLDGRTVVVEPCRAGDFAAQYEART